jgi:hypothetical protein
MGLSPFGTEKGKQQICDKILSTFYIDKNNPTPFAAILQLQGKEILSDLTDDEMADIFSLGKIVTFAALSRRQYFSYGDTYWNASHLSTFIQRYDEAGMPFFAIKTRRRDGSDFKVYDASLYKTHRPFHIDNKIIDIDTLLVKALIQARQTSEEDWPYYEESIDNFNRANTDSPDVALHSEMVTIVGALQRICGSSHLENDFVTKISSLFNPDPSSRIRDLSCYSIKSNSNVPIPCKTLFEFWIRDFNRVRNGCAHGKQKDTYQSIWNMQEHLLFASYIFPLILKYKLSVDKYYSLTEQDKFDINVFESFLDCDNILNPINKENENIKFPWNKIRSTFKLKSIIVRASEQNTQTSE